MRVRKPKPPNFFEATLDAARLPLDAEKSVLGIEFRHGDEKCPLVRPEIDLDGQTERQPLRRARIRACRKRVLL
jgi:hypothetical protein